MSIDFRVLTDTALPWEKMLVNATDIARGEARQLFVRISDDLIISVSRVEDASWDGLVAYAADSETIRLLDLKREPK